MVVTTGEAASAALCCWFEYPILTQPACVSSMYTPPTWSLPACVTWLQPACVSSMYTPPTWILPACVFWLQPTCVSWFTPSQALLVRFI